MKHCKAKMPGKEEAQTLKLSEETQLLLNHIQDIKQRLQTVKKHLDEWDEQQNKHLGEVDDGRERSGRVRGGGPYPPFYMDGMRQSLMPQPFKMPQPFNMPLPQPARPVIPHIQQTPSASPKP